LPWKYPFEANIIKRAEIFVNEYQRNFLERETGVKASWGWLYGEQVKEIQMWITSSLPSQHNKADLLYNNIIFFQNSKNGNYAQLSD
jgi:hypothetical protein